MSAISGVGLGAQVVSGFAEAHRQAIAAGFPDNIDTHGLISGEGRQQCLLEISSRIMTN